MTVLLAALLALPWIIVPIASVIRARRSRSLDEYAPDSHAAGPLVSVVIPARNEAHNIERCVRSVLATAYPRLEVIVVDDHSSDGTGAILQAIAKDDDRLKVVVPAPLPPQWFGKQWACQSGAAASAGDIIAFFDADTWQTADLIPRAVSAMHARTADLLTVVGTQELGTFWEKLVQPQVFAIMFVRYGGTEVVNESRRASEKIANGQCIFVARAEYEAIGGHGAVHDKAAEDLAMAQLYFTTGRRAVVVLGMQQLSTRMYTSLREVIDGWSKNLYASGRDTVPFGAVGRMLYPVMMLVPSLSVLVPPLLLVLSLLGLFGSGVLVWSALVTSANLIWWIVIYAFLDLSPMYALLHPFGGAMLLYISLRAIVRGRNVRWKDRDYVVT
ncbi:MAG: glycosyl transferase family 2 [Gemmatimonadetes bacterium]|nr:glycosyl transferase family 2 [Gemmatimonadota bacterium]